jgi:hypothetical protein
MERLTKKSKNSDMVWFVDHENNNAILEPCEMNSHHDRLVVQKLAAYEDAEEQGLLIWLPCKYVYYLVDVNSKWGGMVMKKSIKDLSLYEIEQIDKRKYYSTREEAEAALERMNKGK